jgi:arylformamidase
MNYSLCPSVTISEITRQSRAAIAWLHREAHNYNASPQRIFVSGHSAGGQQVGMLTATEWLEEYDLPEDIVKGGIAISGVYDLHPLCYSYLQPRLLLTHEEILRQNPQLNIPVSSPPLMVTYGEKETAEFQRQAKDYHKLRRAKGLPGELFVQSGKHHFSAIEGMNETNSIICNTVIDFINRCEQGEIS